MQERLFRKKKEIAQRRCVERLDGRAANMLINYFSELRLIFEEAYKIFKNFEHVPERKRI